VPGKPLRAFDISWVDAASGKYYLGDRSNGAIDVIDVRTNNVLAQIPGFVGATGKNDTSGPDGVLTTFSNREVWTGDGDSTVKVIDLTAGKVVATISSGGKFRVDEMAYDPKDNILMAANNADDPPFATLFSVGTRSVLKKIPFPDATNGAEQPVYDPATGMFYLSVPATKASPGGAVAVIDPVAMSVTAMYGLTNCGPNGAALGPGNQFLAGCGKAGRSVIIDKTNGNVLADFSNGGGSDEVWYNPGDNKYDLAARDMPGGPQLGVIDAATNQWLTNVTTNSNSHSIAVDPSNNHVFVPLQPGGICGALTGPGCVGVYAQQ